MQPPCGHKSGVAAEQGRTSGDKLFLTGVLGLFWVGGWFVHKAMDPNGIGDRQYRGDEVTRC
jgi:hypothetical protein